MAMRATIARHPIHPMLVVFPIGLWVFSFICYIVYLLSGYRVWSTVMMYTLAGGLIGALLAAAAGFIDFLNLRPSRARKVALLHMVLNLTIVALLAVTFFIRLSGEMREEVPFVVMLAGILLLLVSGWLGGSLVYVHGVGGQHTPELWREEPHAPPAAAGPQVGPGPQPAPQM